MGLSFTDELEDLIAALEAADSDYALVGALAVAVYGAPRATTDIDLLVPEEALDAVRAVARDCGFTHEALADHVPGRDGAEEADKGLGGRSSHARPHPR